MLTPGEKQSPVSLRLSGCALQYGADTSGLAATKAGVISHKTILGKRYSSSGTLRAEPQLPSELKTSFMAVLFV